MQTLLVALLLIAHLQTPAPGWWQPAAGETFDIRLQSPEGAINPRVQVIELDVHDADTSLVRELESVGVRTICYFSVGTWEEWRPDADQFPPAVIGNAWNEWPGERYLDTRAIDVLMPIFEHRLDLCVDKGFSGVDPDNIDSWWAETGFPLNQSDNTRLIDRLIDAAHERGLAIGQKNAPELAPAWADRFDFAMTEDCAADSWCDGMQPFLNLGRPVYAIEYTDRTTHDRFQNVCEQDHPAGISFVYKHRELDAWSEFCP